MNQNKARKELEHAGPEAIDVLAGQLCVKNETYQRSVLLFLIHFSTPRVTHVLLETACDSPYESIQSLALNCLDKRPIDFELREKHIQLVRGRLRGGGGAAAQVAPLFGTNSIRSPELVALLVKSFVKQAEAPGRPILRGHGFSTDRDSFLNRYVLAFRRLGEVAIPELEREWSAAASPDVKKWLTIGLGCSGYGPVADDLRRVYDAEEDMTVKSIALRGYCCAAREDALPLLRKIVAENPRPSQKPMTMGSPRDDVLGGVARDELHRLECSPEEARRTAESDVPE